MSFPNISSTYAALQVVEGGLTVRVVSSAVVHTPSLSNAERSGGWDIEPTSQQVTHRMYSMCLHSKPGEGRDGGGFGRRVDFRREAMSDPYLIWRAVEGEAKFSLKVWSPCEVREPEVRRKKSAGSLYEHLIDHVKTLLVRQAAHKRTTVIRLKHMENERPLGWIMIISTL